ncbi:hypothetical protein EYZ11_011889 [Aspergillus tanneri]|uniref:Trafficking protein particle complex subunit n=1 Tax=Aspergillus tanneri TaxID=1220188 RepID=A0A4S3J1M5_9EURO|nr:hypothetical protein EYZ11_011889 [Aspergillus tanneri]
MVVYSFYIFDRHALAPQPELISRQIFASNFRGVCPDQWITPPLDQSVQTTDDDAKLIFGTVFSLRNMARKLGGDDDSFVTYRTSQYKLHYYETPTNIKFVMLTDIKSPTMRIALQQIYINLYVEYGARSVQNSYYI